jgi:hypothetical protein
MHGLAGFVLVFRRVLIANIAEQSVKKRRFTAIMPCLGPIVSYLYYQP